MTTTHTGKLGNGSSVHALRDDGFTICGNAPVTYLGRAVVTCGACLNSPKLTTEAS
jgi:hypothetical protein